MFKVLAVPQSVFESLSAVRQFQEYNPSFSVKVQDVEFEVPEISVVWFNAKLLFVLSVKYKLMFCNPDESVAEQLNVTSTGGLDSA